MKRHLIRLITGLLTIMSIAAMGCWGVFRNDLIVAVWTSGTDHIQVLSYKGSVYFVRNHDWWRHEDFAIQFDQNPGDDLIVKWPGMQLDEYHTLLGFTKAHGKWVAPYVDVPTNTRFTSVGVAIKPGAMYRSITPIELYGAPRWIFLGLPALWLAGQIFIRIRRMQTPRDRMGHGASVRAHTICSLG